VTRCVFRALWIHGKIRALNHRQKFVNKIKVDVQQLEFQFLGIPQIARDGAVVNMRTRRDVALLAYLVLEPEPHSRDKLANLFWAFSDSNHARHNLRNALTHVRAVVGDALKTDRFHISLERQERVDVFALEGLGEVSLRTLAGVLEPMKTVLLDGFEFQEAPDWQVWLEEKRQRVQEVLETRFERLMQLHEQVGDVKAALASARRRLALDDLNEQAHRHVIRLELLRGNRSGALEAFERCRRIFQQELGVAPAKETRALLEIPTDNAPLSSTATPSKSSVVQLDQGLALVGRERAWAQLEAAWGQKMFIFIVGEPGSGKSRLIDEFIKAKTGRPADAVINGRPDDPHVPYATISRALRRMFELFPNPPLEPWVYRELGRILPDLDAASSTPSSGEALRLSEALSEFMLHFGRRFQLWVTDDLQFYDEATWQAATHAWYKTTTEWMQNGGQPPTLIAAYRTGEMSAAGETLMQIGLDAGIGVRIDLEPLDRTAIAQLLEQFEPTIKAPDLIAASLERFAGGNPMLLLETLKSLRETKEIAGLTPARLEQLRERRELPRSSRVRRAIEPRLAALSKTAHDLARVIAIAGEHFTLALAQTVLESSSADLIAASEELERAGLIRDTRFAHDLLLETVLEQILPMSKRILHHRVLEHLERDRARASVLYQHAVLSGQVLAIAEHGIKAALEARSLGLQDEARNLLSRVGAALPDGLKAHLLEDALRLSQELQMADVSPIFALALQPHLQRLPNEKAS
jgi:DNA-binding SARP family transcriptional activator